MANTHPNSIFRWEDAASLEHACWACPTKANSPRALHTCYGTHSMPCTSYHPTMHAVGAAHRCSGCVNTREMHDARHREIAELLAEFNTLEIAPAAITMPNTSNRMPLLERNVNINAASRHIEERRNAAAPDFEIATDQENLETDDTTSMSSHTLSSTSTLATPKRKLSKAEERTQKREKRAVKSQTKALRNQNKNLASVTMSDVEHVSVVLHGADHDKTFDGSAHPLATDQTIEDVISRNLNFVKSIRAHKEYLFRSVVTGRKEINERKRLKRRESRGESTGDAVEMEEVASAIMLKLGICSAAVSASMTEFVSPPTGWTGRSNPNKLANRKRADSNLIASPQVGNSKGAGVGVSRSGMAIAAKLRAAIKTDLEKHENEVHMRYVRAGGFWRYVGRTVFDRMTEVAQDLDVSTGERWEKKWAREERFIGGNEELVPDGLTVEKL